MDKSLLVYGLTFLAIDILIFWRITDPRPSKEKFKFYFSVKGVLIGLYSFIFFLFNFLSGMYFSLPTSEFDPLITLLGLFVFIAGAVIAIWAKVSMGKVWGMPAGHDYTRQNKLIKHGPFQYSRNPIYVGLVMVLIGYGLAIQSYFTFLALVPIIYFWRSVEKEEELLEKYFKEEYLKYKKEVPRFF